ncbi:hypothetical protein [Hyunsoonleella rubra]|uniref:GHKL domain-containing protein n=1 Tax=Hyunsoonleella rubra TaxID=1737062 RepID=A0ABW5TFK8_9FLAO
MTLEEIDYDIRKFNSIFLRLVLFVLLFLIYDRNDNFYEPLTYLITAALYLILLLINYKLTKKKYKGKCRLILDLLIIGIFLFRKDLSSTINYMPYMLLLFNMNSHSNRKSNILVFIILFHLSILVACNFKFIWTFQLIPVLFYGFVFFYFVRKYFRVLNEKVIESIGDLFIENVNNNTNHHILENVKAHINKKKTLKNFLTIENLYLFVRLKENLVLIKGSEFVKTDPKIVEEEKKKLFSFLEDEKSTLLFTKEIVIDGKEYDNLVWVKHEILRHQYVFLIATKSYLGYIGGAIVSSLRPIFEYIARIFYVTNRLDNLQKEQTEIIKEKVTHVLDAQNALHFVKNKLSPITRTINLVDRLYKKPEKLSEKKKNYIKQELKNNTNNEKVKEILRKAEVLIKGVDNLLNQEDEIVSVKRIIDVFRQNWLHHFNSTESIFVDIKDVSNTKISFNSMLYDFVFTDIIENISKYSNDFVSIVFTQENETEISMYFVNSIKDFEKNYRELKKICELYNREDNDEIYKRNTHGLSFVRLLLRRKLIENEISIDKSRELFTFKITLKLA